MVIAVSACLGLSIRQAAESAKEETMGSMSVTATISFDRSSLMQGMQKPDSSGGGFPQGGFDRNQFQSMMSGSEEFEPVSNSKSSDSEDTESKSEENSNEGGIKGPGGFGGPGGFRDQMFGAQSDFSVVGYSKIWLY